MTVEMCTVRYWISTAKFKDSDVFRNLKAVMDSISDLLPWFEFVEDGYDLWCYCSFPIEEKFKRIVNSEAAFQPQWIEYYL